MRVRFGNCVFDDSTREVLRDGRSVPISPKAFDLLGALLEHRPRVLSKPQIHDILWPKTFVSESSLTRLMAELRSAVGDEARKPRFVRTVHGFGYAYCGEATEETAPRVRAAKVPGCWVSLGKREFALGEGDNVIGRDQEAEVFIDSPKVSRHHARIRVSAGRALLEDLGSKNGTFHDGRRIKDPVELRDGDEIALGPVFLTFRSARAAGSTESVGPPVGGE